MKIRKFLSYIFTALIITIVCIACLPIDSNNNIVQAIIGLFLTVSIIVYIAELFSEDKKNE